MTEKLKRQQVIKELRQQLVSRFGGACDAQINKELLRLMNKKTLDSKDFLQVKENIRK